MKPELADRLKSPLRLNRANAAAAAVLCKICEQPAPFFEVVNSSKCAYGLVDPEYESIRSRLVADRLAQYLGSVRGARILDCGTGGGEFVVRMGELGFGQVANYDPLSRPTPSEGTFDIISCAEVVERVPFELALLEAIRSLLNEGRCIILGETLQPRISGRCGQTGGMWRGTTGMS